VLTASTGVIGARLPAMKIVTALPALVEQLGDHPDLAAEAIITTDTRIKMTAREVVLGGKTAVVSAICKGSGMLAPQLATTLCLIVTDAAVSPPALQEILGRAVKRTLNMVTVDGETSTNDTVYLLANGLAGNARVTEAGPDLDRLETALTDLLGEMARAMAADGEGATRMLEVEVTGAPDEEIAAECARAITSSPLVKTALFGADPNWGRILAAVGNAGVDIDPDRVDIRIGDVLVARHGAAVEGAREAAHAVMKQERYRISVHLHRGRGSGRHVTCDLGTSYVRLNADYST